VDSQGFPLKMGIASFRNINTSRASGSINENLSSEDAIDHFDAVRDPVVISVQRS
jgi:hypothetical protein